MNPVTKGQIARIRSLCEIATPGPWFAELDMFSSEEGIVACVSDIPNNMIVKLATDLTIDPGVDGAWTAADSERRDAQWRLARDGQEIRDAYFIAAARDDVPMLLAEVERLRAGLKQLQIRILDDRDLRPLDRAGYATTIEDLLEGV